MSEQRQQAMAHTLTSRSSRSLLIVAFAVGALNLLISHQAQAESSLEGLEMDVMNPLETGTDAANRISLPLPQSNVLPDEHSGLIDLANPERNTDHALDSLRATEAEASQSIETSGPAGNE